MENSILQYQTRILLDKRVSVWHIGTYLALLHLLRQNQGVNPITISRKILMPIARIKSIPTYHKYMTDLVRFGYIHYHPSYHPKQASKVFIIS